MVSGSRWKIVGQEMSTAASTIVASTMIATAAFAADGLIVSTTEEITAFVAELWWVGVVVAITTIFLNVISDRSRVGMWTLVAVDSVGIIALVWLVITGQLPVIILSIVLVGLGIGTVTNRFLFGVVRPIPEARRRREQTNWYDWF